VRWNQTDIYLWIKLGCPSAKLFNNMKIGEDMSKVGKDRLIGHNEVMTLTNVKRAKFWNMRSSGQLPSPVSLGRSVRWRLSDIIQWFGLDGQSLTKCG
jgi:predicted DNA-binding transcriptional regulator AlpA